MATADSLKGLRVRYTSSGLAYVLAAAGVLLASFLRCGPGFPGNGYGLGLAGLAFWVAAGVGWWLLRESRELVLNTNEPREDVARRTLAASGWSAWTETRDSIRRPTHHQSQYTWPLLYLTRLVGGEYLKFAWYNGWESIPLHRLFIAMAMHLLGGLWGGLRSGAVEEGRSARH